MGKKLNFWEMSNINAMEELSVLMPQAWIEDPGDGNCMDCDCDYDGSGNCKDCDCDYFNDDDDDDE